MARLQFPAYFEQKSILSALSKSELLKPDWSDLEILLSPQTRLIPSGVALFGSWVLQSRKAGKRISIECPSNIRERMGMLQIEALVGPGFAIGSGSPIQHYVPIQTISNDEDLFRTVNLICDLILKNIGEAGTLLPAVEWCANEVVDNILRHSDSEVPGCVCATFDATSRKLEIAISDSGRGILNSIRESHSPFNNAEAIGLAITRGVTRDTNVGQGFGLAGSLEIVEKSRGSFELTSGDIRLDRKVNAEKFTQVPFMPGTLVVLSFDTNQPISLEDTTIIGSGSPPTWNYFDVLREKSDVDSVFEVANECIHFGGRGPAKALRTKLKTVLDRTHEPVTLDFSRVDTAASSFLDELLGRLISELGVNSFRQNVKIKNMNETVEKMAHVVMKNRLEVDGIKADLGR